MNPKVDAFFKSEQKWRKEVKELRRIILGSPLTEDMKWSKPCYALDGTNLLIIQPFKDYIALMFWEGALLKDAQGLLVKPGENTQAARQLRFTSAREIVALEPTIKAYITEAIAAERAGLKAKRKTTPEPIPAELTAKCKEVPALKKAFEALTPGRRRAYLMHFNGAKQSATRTARVERWLPQIMRGQGLND